MKRMFPVLLMMSSLAFHITPVSSQSLPKWGLVYGSDPGFEDARNEILRFMVLNRAYLTHPERGGFPRKGN